MARRNTTENGPHPVDAHVGERLRAIRRERGLSLENLAEAVGVTFQQIQKYEKAQNRISASMVVELAHALDVPIATFFAGLETWNPERAHG